MRYKVNYMSTHTTAIDAGDPSTVWLSKDAHATAWLWTQHSPCLQNIFLCSKPLVLPIL
jgi:hypothetical protein